MKILGRLAGSALLTFLLTSTASAEDATAHDVIIVGAGAAGMEAARVAAADGHSVLIIEAKDYIGGRVHSVLVGQTMIEAGAEEHYDNYETTKAIEQAYGNNIYGAGYEGAEVYGLDAGVNTCWFKDGTVNSEIDCDTQNISAANSIGDDFWKDGCSGSYTAADWLDAKYGVKEGDRMWHLFAASYWEAGIAGSPKRIGCQPTFNAGYSWTLSENPIKAVVPYNVGYTELLTTLYWQPTLDHANVDHLLSSPVVKIEEVSDDNGKYVEVTTATGGVHTAWRVIVTVSIGVLQDEIIDFVPDLPNATVNAYNDMGFDDGFKIAMRFSRDDNGNAFWESEGEVGWMAFSGTIGACWVPTNYKTGYPGAKDAIMLCYPMGDNGTAFMATAAAAGGDPDQMDGGVTEEGAEAVIAEVMAQLDVMFPNQLGQASATYTGDHHVQSWGAEPYTRGVYSIETPTSWPGMGQNNANSRNTIRAPHYSNKLFFAGEGTNRGNGATVPGARQEGARAADDVDGTNMPNGQPPIKGPDETAPVVTLNGAASIITFQNQTFTDPGATANDNRDGEVSVQVSGNVDTSTLGSYPLIYSATDAAGNTGSANRTVIVSVYIDLVAPIITLIGDNPTNLDFGEAYIELGATASDNDDGDVTANIETTGSVDSSISGTYTITYTVSDTAGNEGTATRSVTVGPEPGITLIPTKSLYAPGEAIAIEYTEGSGSNKDWIGVYLTSNPPIDGSFNVAATLWSYTNGSAGTINWSDNIADGDYIAVLYSNDSYNFYGEVGYFSVGSSPDVTAPVITVNGGAVSVEQFSAYNDAGATANDDRDGNVSVQVSSNVDTNTVGSYTVTYSASDAAGNAATPATRTVIVTAYEDNVAPIITLSGASIIELELNEAYIESGATASDNVDGDVSANIVISGSVDSSTAGTYTITYSVSDAAGNSTVATRNVTVNEEYFDTIPPVITLNGASSITLDFEEAYSEAGATASDNDDGNISANIVISGFVDSSIAGIYPVTYSVSDAAGNSTTVTRTVTVEEYVEPPLEMSNLILASNGGSLESFTSEYNNQWSAAKLTNGVTNEDGWASKKDPGTQEFIYSFANGDSVNLSDAVIHSGTAENRYWAKDVQVWTSADGSNYTLAASGTLANNSSASITLDLSGIVAKRVKLVVTSGYRTDYWEIGEFAVNGWQLKPVNTMIDKGLLGVISQQALFLTVFQSKGSQ